MVVERFFSFGCAGTALRAPQGDQAKGDPKEAQATLAAAACVWQAERFTAC